MNLGTMTELNFAFIVELYTKLGVKSDLVNDEFFEERLKDEPKLKERLVRLLTAGIKDETESGNAQQ